MTSDVQTQQSCAREQPAECFLKHLEERLAVDEELAAATLGSWLLQYEPGPLALARARVRIERNVRKQRVAA
jgi:hypothetical protein